MSELALFKNADVAIPDYLRDGAMDEVARALMGGASGTKRISIRGNVFRMIVDGQEVAKSDDRGMEVVIVKAANHTSRTYYAGTYREGEKTAPACWSNDGVKPSPQAENPQGTACATCPMNVAGSGQGSSRACRYSRRLAVVLGNNIENSHVYQLVLPAQSLFGKAVDGKMPLEAYVKLLAGHELGPRSVVTEMRFDTSSATPKLTFSAVRPLTREEYDMAVEKGESADAERAIAYNPAQLDGAKKTEVVKPRVAVAAPVVEKAAPVAVAEEPTEPVVREKKQAATTAPQDLASVLAEWGEDD